MFLIELLLHFRYPANPISVSWRSFWSKKNCIRQQSLLEIDLPPTMHICEKIKLYLVTHTFNYLTPTWVAVSKNKKEHQLECLFQVRHWCSTCASSVVQVVLQLSPLVFFKKNYHHSSGHCPCSGSSWAWRLDSVVVSHVPTIIGLWWSKEVSCIIAILSPIPHCRRSPLIFHHSSHPGTAEIAVLFFTLDYCIVLLHF